MGLNISHVEYSNMASLYAVRRPAGMCEQINLYTFVKVIMKFPVNLITEMVLYGKFGL